MSALSQANAVMAQGVRDENDKLATLLLEIKRCQTTQNWPLLYEKTKELQRVAFRIYMMTE